ncbi:MULTISPECIES: diaminopimelate decarboxylase [unclassified Streptomyces]|uniref:diaminopimelate decarboxylase n=1 Tax=unclassified Streptomyces TaxID=2593676 RepID=UPI002E2AD9FC|nr:diaminopimelate decarboxylase [Streptomyces sp. NBC_01601]
MNDMSDTLKPDWLTEPADLNALSPYLWPATAARDTSGVLTVGGLRVTDLAAEFGTPMYLFDEDDFRARCAEFRTAFHDFDVYYAGKAFLCKAVARICAEAGLGLDVCTLGELKTAIAAGFPGARMVLHGNNKSAEELTTALRHGVARIVVDSFDELALLKELAADTGVRPTVLVRVNVGVRADTHANIATAHDDQKFGFSLRTGDAAAAVAYAHDADGIELAGLHMHLGSQIFGMDSFEVGVERMMRVRADFIRTCGAELPEVSVGGGFAIAYRDHHQPLAPAGIADALRRFSTESCRELGVDAPRLAIEPGRAVVGRSAFTVYRVGTVKNVEGLRAFVSVDGGMSDNIRPALYDGIYSAVLADRLTTAEPRLSRVVGVHCDAGDVVVRDDYLASDIHSGDLLAVPCTGAYCRSLSNNFNHTPRPPVVAVGGGTASVWVRRETYDDLLGLDLG